MKWDDVSKSKANRGLETGRVKEKNLALLGKWLWRFTVERNFLWQSIITSSYGMDANRWDVQQTIPHLPSLMWKSIGKIAPQFYSHTCFGLGNGNRIRFWKDLWWGTKL